MQVNISLAVDKSLRKVAYRSVIASVLPRAETEYSTLSQYSASETDVDTTAC